MREIAPFWGDFFYLSSWPGLSRLSTPYLYGVKTWMPGIRLRQGFGGFVFSPQNL
jgi:hypothetical protein